MAQLSTLGHMATNMNRITTWTIFGALTGLAFAILGSIPPTYPSGFWFVFYQIGHVAMKPAMFALRCWLEWIPLPNGQYVSLTRFFVVNIAQWLLLGFLVGASAHLSIRHRKQICERQFKRDHDNVA